jgi:hypothetical protein
MFGLHSMGKPWNCQSNNVANMWPITPSLDFFAAVVKLVANLSALQQLLNAMALDLLLC